MLLWNGIIGQLLNQAMPCYPRQIYQLFFWCYAVKYAVLIYNHLPTNTAYGYMSPIQAKYNIVPNVSHFRKFGCKCYVHIHREKREKGFVDKAEAAYFLGIDIATQSYVTWIISLNEEKISSNVLFDELAVVTIQPVTSTLQLQPTPKNIKDFLYLLGMIYRDNENRLMYICTSPLEWLFKRVLLLLIALPIWVIILRKKSLIPFM